MKKSILDNNNLEEFRKLYKLEPYRIKQINYEIFGNSNIYFHDMSTISIQVREKLEEYFEIVQLELKEVLDGFDSTKFIFETKDGKSIETVLMYHRHENEKIQKLNRITICVSSQVGCAVGCIFCVTGKLGFGRNLTYYEIIGQILYANYYIKNKFGKKEDGTLHKVRNVVFMGMGEPLLNYENLLKSIDLMLEQTKFGLSKRHITISTSGIIPGINRLIEDNINVMLAVSLHAPNQDLRKKLIPTISSPYSLDLLIETINNYIEKTGNRIFYEYIMIKGLTDTKDLAYELSSLLKGQFCHINLIPYNQNPTINFEESTQTTIKQFKQILEENGLTVTVRASLGRQHNGACGQLGYKD